MTHHHMYALRMEPLHSDHPSCTFCVCIAGHGGRLQPPTLPHPFRQPQADTQAQALGVHACAPAPTPPLTSPTPPRPSHPATHRTRRTQRPSRRAPPRSAAAQEELKRLPALRTRRTARPAWRGDSRCPGMHVRAGGDCSGPGSAP